ncbi:MAG TPA: adenylosuccinate synthetase, partial [Acidobacteriaceae bacterium]|nr:adenylosuccinate synthetase [Acidobacteriaceae bacterium]
LPLLRYSTQINGTEWLVVTKLDVLDTLEQIPVCTGYKIGGKTTDTIPADVRGLESIEPILTQLKGWNTPTENIQTYEALPAAAKDYLRFLEQESGARIGMISTGPDRDQTILLPGFAATLNTMSAG